jgi:Mg-chelatase subunit ChlD
VFRAERVIEMRRVLLVAVVVGVCACATSPDEDVERLSAMPAKQATLAPKGQLKVAIRNPSADLVLTNWETSIEVEGGASVFGGVRFLDLLLVLDSSKSLQRSDPKDYRTVGAVGLVEALPAKSDIQVGVVDFDSNGELVLPLTSDRSAAIQALRGLNQFGRTDIGAGIRTAVDEFERNARPDSSRVILLFTDGQSNADKARRATAEAQRRGVAIHTLLLGSSRKGASILREIAGATWASFVRVTDPAKLPEAFLNLRTTGVDRVTVRIDDSPPIPARLVGGTFSARVPLRVGENRVVATATSLDGETREDGVTVVVSGPMKVAIDSPTDGTLFTDHETEMVVSGAVDAFVNLSPRRSVDYFDWGVQSVVLKVNDSRPFVAVVEDGRFQGRVPLRVGENRIVAVASSRDGRTAGDAVHVTVRPPGCAELTVRAVSDGRPALSISDRAVEIVFDASNSMWGQIDGRAKIDVAKQVLRESLDWLPRDLKVGLRVYGHQHKRELRVCTDSELLVPLRTASGEQIEDAISTVRPRGQTPLAYSLDQVAGDFGELRGERAVVLVTDGIESCGGDPVAAARALQAGGGIPVHVIGFGLGSEADADAESLQAIADASGGRFLTARSAEELREALVVTVGTAFRVFRGETLVAKGALGDDHAMLLPEGDYRVWLDSAPPHEASVTLAREEGLTLVLQREEGAVSRLVQRGPTDYAPCEAAADELEGDPLRGGTQQRGAANYSTD